MAKQFRRKRIVILRGGCGGIVAATHRGRKLGADHDVILIDRRPVHVFMPAFLFLMVGEREPADITGNLKNLEKRDVQFVQDEVIGIDPARQEVTLRSSKVSYDYLIVASSTRRAGRPMPRAIRAYGARAG